MISSSSGALLTATGWSCFSTSLNLQQNVSIPMLIFLNVMMKDCQEEISLPVFLCLSVHKSCQFQLVCPIVVFSKKYKVKEPVNYHEACWIHSASYIQVEQLALNGHVVILIPANVTSKDISWYPFRLGQNEWASAVQSPVTSMGNVHKTLSITASISNNCCMS